MKNYLIVLFTFICFSGFSQISFGARHVGKPVKLKKEDIEKFKATTTIFVLSNIIDKAEYEKMLKDTWTVTPYKIVSAEDFSINDYYKGNYSIGELMGYKTMKQMKSGGVVTRLHTYFNVGVYDAEEIDKKLAKLKVKKNEKRKSKINRIFFGNKKAIAKFYVFPTSEFVNEALTEESEIIMESMYTKDVFFNYTTGMLKNYFQKTNDLIAAEETYWMYEKDFNQEKLAGLATTKLYIPEYVTQWTDAWGGGIIDRDNEEIKKLFKDYDYDYEFVSKEDLDAAILENKEFYYLRYIRVNAERFAQVVNAKTGDVVYRDYFPGFLSYNLKSKNLGALSKAIAKSAKKLAK